MPKSESLMLQCSFIYPQSGKKCSNQSENRTYCSLHLLILKCDNNNKNVDINLQQTNLEERTSNLIQRVKRIQDSQLRIHISKQLCAFVKYQQEQMNYSCQHPQHLQNIINNSINNTINNSINNLIDNFSNQSQQIINNNNKLVNGDLSQSIHNHINSTSSSLNIQINNIKQEKDTIQLNNQINSNQLNNQLLTIKEENDNNNNGKQIRKPLSSTTSKLNNTNNQSTTNSNIIINRKCLAPKFNSDQIKQINTTTGIIRSNLKHFEYSYDSDATESSSGGESCDELDDYLNDLCKQQKLDLNLITPLPLNQKSNWKWALERGAICSRWTWLQAQIADLDFKIRQQNELYKQFRSSKGQISFYSNESNQPTENGEPQSCVRTLPLKEMKKRKLVRSVFALTNANRKIDRHSTVLCSCNSLPSFSNSCILCNDRYSYIQTINTDCMPISERIALLDASYHSILSLPENVSLGLHFSKLLKKETVQRPATRNSTHKKKKICSKSELKCKNELKPKKKSQALIQSTKLKKKYEGNNKKHQLLTKKANKVRLNTTNNKTKVNNNHKERYESSNYSDESSRHDSPSPFVNTDGSLMSNSLRRRRSEQNAYDPFNIVIPYSIASTTRVERLQYKEIITPKWRVTETSEELKDSEFMDIDKQHIILNKSSSEHKSTSDHKLSPKPFSSSLNKLLINKSPDKLLPEKLDSNESISESFSLANYLSSIIDNDRSSNDNSFFKTNHNDEDSNHSNHSQSTEEETKSDSLEDLSDEIFIERHLKCEADEKKRFSTYLKNPLNGTRGRGAVRQRTESTKSESINLESNTIDGSSSQDSFSNMQLNLNMSTTSDKATTIGNQTAKSPELTTNTTNVFEDNSNQSTSKTKIYSISSKKDDQLMMDEENHVEVIPYEKRNFPLNENEFQNLLS